MAESPMDNEFWKALDQCYNALIGEKFAGTYLGTQALEVRTKEWDWIEVTPGDPFNEKLDKIVDIAQGKVWKGFTGPQDSYMGYKWNYRLFVDLHSHSISIPTVFKVVKLEPFNIRTASAYKLNTGFAIQVEAIS